MESQVLSIEQEARRIAACFGVEEWYRIEREGDYRFYGRAGLLDVVCEIHKKDGYLIFVNVRRPCVMSSQWTFDRPLILGSPHTYGLMARGLYCLGIEIEQLPEISAHVKMEARLSLPREFWPQSWLEELKP